MKTLRSCAVKKCVFLSLVKGFSNLFKTRIFVSPHPLNCAPNDMSARHQVRKFSADVPLNLAPISQFYIIGSSLPVSLPVPELGCTLLIRKTVFAAGQS